MQRQREREKSNDGDGGGGRRLDAITGHYVAKVTIKFVNFSLNMAEPSSQKSNFNPIVL